VNGIFIPFPFSFFLSCFRDIWEGGERLLVIAFVHLIQGFYQSLPYRWLWEITGYELDARQLFACAASLHNFARAPAQ